MEDTLRMPKLQYWKYDTGLRQEQIDSYVKICEHFLMNKSKEHAIAILPTGSGKTGVMAIAIAPIGVA